MKHLRAAAALALALVYCGTATAETFTDFGVVIKKKSTASEDELNNGYLPLVNGTGNDVRKTPSDGITRNTATQTLTGKTIDCLNNNCLNFPGGGGTTFIPPTTCTVEGELYNNGGVLTICHISVAGGSFLLNGGGNLALNGGGVLSLNP